MAGFRYQKDQDTAIRALALLPGRFHLYLVGDGERRAELEALVASHGLQERVHFMGVRDDVPGLLKSASIAVMSSHWEGFGLAAAEAMAAGMPVIASDVDGLSEVVQGAGVLFEHGNERQLAHKILQLESDRGLYDRVAARCMERAAGFDIAQMVRGYDRLYRSLLPDKM